MLKPARPWSSTRCWQSSTKEESAAKFGTPVLEGATVSASVVKNGRGKKVRVFKMKPKKGYRRTQGHRQPYTKVEIKTINA